MDDPFTDLFPAHLTLPPLFGSDEMQFDLNPSTHNHKPAEDASFTILNDLWGSQDAAAGSESTLSQQQPQQHHYAFSEPNCLNPFDLMRQSPRQTTTASTTNHQRRIATRKSKTVPESSVDSKNPQLIAARRRILNKAFTENPRPSKLKRDHLSRVLGMDTDLVAKWFSRKRQLTNPGNQSPSDNSGGDSSSKSDENFLVITTNIPVSLADKQTSESAAEQFRKSHRSSLIATSALANDTDKPHQHQHQQQQQHSITSLTAAAAGKKGSVFYDWMLKSPRKKKPAIIRRRSAKVAPLQQQQPQPHNRHQQRQQRQQLHNKSPTAAQLRFEEVDKNNNSQPVGGGGHFQRLLQHADVNVFSSPGPQIFDDKVTLPGTTMTEADDPFTDSQNPISINRLDLFKIASEPPPVMECNDIFANDNNTAAKCIFDSVNLSPGSDISRLLQESPGKKFESDLLKLFSESPGKTAGATAGTKRKAATAKHKSPRKPSKLRTTTIRTAESKTTDTEPSTQSKPADTTTEVESYFFDAMTNTWDDFL